MGIAEALTEMVSRAKGDGLFQVTVTSVNEAQRTFDGVDVDGNEIYDIRMQAVTVNDGLLLIPMKGAKVLVMALGRGRSELVALAFSSLAKVIAQLEGSYLEITPGGILLQESVALGGSQGEPGVKGEALNQNLDLLNQNLTTLASALSAFASAQATAAAASPSPGLAPAYSALLLQLQALQPGLSAWGAGLPQHLSTKVTLS